MSTDYGKVIITDIKIPFGSMGGWHIRMKIEPDEPEAQALRKSAKRKIMERKTKTS